MAKKKSEALLDLPVQFGNVNVGDKTARVGVTIGRSSISISAADKNLCERRLRGTIIARPVGASADQSGLPGMDGEDIEVAGTFDVKGFGVSKKSLSTGLTFALSEIEVSVLANFAKREGRLLIVEVGDLPKEADSNGESEEAE